MNKEIKKKWINALKSGKYKQGRQALRPATNRYCCLGVLCDIYVKEKGAKWNLRKGSYSINSAATDLPEAVLLWAGIGINGLSVDYGGEKMHLADCNDVKKLNFNTIAGLIEKQF